MTTQGLILLILAASTTQVLLWWVADRRTERAAQRRRASDAHGWDGVERRAAATAARVESQVDMLNALVGAVEKMMTAASTAAATAAAPAPWANDGATSDLAAPRWKPSPQATPFYREPETDDSELLTDPTDMWSPDPGYLRKTGVVIDPQDDNPFGIDGLTTK